MVPYWLCEGPCKVERRVPVLPYSREVGRLKWLKRNLSIYRIAFGQPRQDDLLAYLEGLVDSGLDIGELESSQISLAPPEKEREANSIVPTRI